MHEAPSKKLPVSHVCAWTVGTRNKKATTERNESMGWDIFPRLLLFFTVGVARSSGGGGGDQTFFI